MERHEPSLGWENFLICFSQYSWAGDTLHCLLHIASGCWNKSYKNNQIFVRKIGLSQQVCGIFFYHDCPWTQVQGLTCEVVVWMLGIWCARDLMCIKWVQQNPCRGDPYIFAFSDALSCDEFDINQSQHHEGVGCQWCWLQIVSIWAWQQSQVVLYIESPEYLSLEDGCLTSYRIKWDEVCVGWVLSLADRWRAPWGVLSEWHLTAGSQWQNFFTLIITEVWF